MPKRDAAYPLCRHTKTDGRLCNSPALTDRAFCHHHQKLRRARRTTISAGPALSTHVLYPLRDARNVLQAISMVYNGVLTGRIHTRTAGRMLYALQMAIKELG
jgi:hypothetical protein